MQKPPFCTPKTILLFFVSITNTLLICYEYSVKWLRTPTKCPTNTPQNVHIQPRNTHEHTARRRDRFIVPVSLHYQIHIFVSPNTHFRFIIHEYSHYQICVSIPRFVGVFIYAGTINRTPTAADGLPITLLTVCDNAMFKNKNYSFT